MSEQSGGTPKDLKQFTALSRYDNRNPLPTYQHVGLPEIITAAASKNTEVSYTPSSLDEIQEKLFAETRFKLPPELADTYGLAKLQWTELSLPFALPHFYIGTPREEERPLPASALGTIILNKAIAEDTKVSSPRDIHIAGVSADSNGDTHAVGLTFSTYHGHLTSVNTSASPSEIPDNLKHQYNAVNNLPTKNDAPFSTSGFVTEAMLGKTRGHAQSIRNYSATMSPLTGQDLRPEAKNAGFGFGHKGIFRPKTFMRYTPPSGNTSAQKWELILPSHLQR